MHRRANLHPRRGYVLVYFALLSFALMAVAALVIDLGFAIVARRQMQTAVDSAALEGLRFRDSIPSSWQTDQATTDAIQAAGLDPTKPDDVRRWAARRNLVMTFDDNLNPSDGDPSPSSSSAGGPSNFGAGPVVSFQDGPNVPAGGDSIAASQSYQFGLPDSTDPNAKSPTVYKPSDPNWSPSTTDLPWPFQLNLSGQGMSANAQGGDMVSGNYTSFPSDPQAPVLVQEDSSYSRMYMSQQSVLSSQFQPDPSPSANAFLVRMRRSNETQDPGQGLSAGPPLPYLFGRGSLLTTQTKGSETVWAKRQGITVRATGIALARRALSVGPSIPALGLPGVTPFGLQRTFWDSLTANSPVSVQIDQAGQILSGGTRVGQVTRLTTLASDVDETSSTISVGAISGFPSSVPFTIRIDDELMEVVGVDATNWSVIRGLEATTPSAHGAQASIALANIASVGQLFMGSQPDGLVLPLETTDRYVPIFEVVENPTSGLSVERIVGFGQALLTSPSGPPPTRPYQYPLTLSLEKQPSTVASQNATTRFIPPTDSITSDELSTILGPTGSNLSYLDPLLASTLVRSE